MGVSLGQEIKNATKGKKTTIEAVKAATVPMMNGFGVTYTLKEKPGRLIFEISRCPMYDGFKAAGFEHDQIVKLCNSMAPKEYQGVTSVLPEVTGKLQTRKSQKGNCIEEWTVK